MLNQTEAGASMPGEWDEVGVGVGVLLCPEDSRQRIVRWSASGGDGQGDVLPVLACGHMVAHFLGRYWVTY